MAAKIELTTATPADIAADMDQHRRMYGRFLRLLRYSAAAIAVILFLLFIGYAT